MPLFGYLIAQLHPLSFLPAEGSARHHFVEVLVSVLACLILFGLFLGVRAVFGLRRELRERKAEQQRTLEMAQHDALTGLPNRRKFQETLIELTASLAPEKYRAVMMLDMDGFKTINDVYGHGFGDALLTSFAERLRRTVGEDGIVARLGGDEFAVVTPEISEVSEASALANRILQRIQEVFVLESRQVTIGSGIGISIFPDDGYSPAELLRRADIALYRAKTSGRSSYCFFEVDMDATILHTTLLEQRLRNAIENRLIKVYYQPILDLGTREIVGFEALARWSDPDFGQVSPAQFVPIAEDCGLIGEMTETLLSEACSVAKTWPRYIGLNFNISPLQLQDLSFPLKIISVLSQTGLQPDRLTLEITETALMRNADTAQVILRQLSDAGVRIALDDFGTGHSSLTYLRDFPIDRVKIDKSFTMHLADSKECEAIVESILVLSRGLGVEAVAEGIEQQEVLRKLSDSGCNLGQGFLFGAARPQEKLAEMLRRADEPEAERARHSA
ncbi:putative bifunctional diguanylate cyclase/phosphodiesterase [Roseibium sp.]|uniref:putative bifunctional diguanylate cyclase/phosphodiesterase n=1 Tax=Roseibium sp. TaxID=1936156 RepID=UPI003A96EA63